MGFNDFAGSTVVHAVGGFGTLAAALVLDPRLGKYKEDGSITPIPGHNLSLAALESGLCATGSAHQLGVQALGVASIGLFAFIITFLIMTILKKTIGIRVSIEEELAGIDAGSFGVESYSTFE